MSVPSHLPLKQFSETFWSLAEMRNISSCWFWFPRRKAMTCEPRCSWTDCVHDSHVWYEFMCTGLSGWKQASDRSWLWDWRAYWDWKRGEYLTNWTVRTLKHSKRPDWDLLSCVCGGVCTPVARFHILIFINGSAYCQDWWRSMNGVVFAIKKDCLDWDFPLLPWIVFDRLCSGTVPRHWQQRPQYTPWCLCYLLSAHSKLTLFCRNVNLGEKALFYFCKPETYTVIFTIKAKLMHAHTHTQPTMTGGWIFYMFIHFNFTASVLLKCCSAAYINSFRLGSDRLGPRSHTLLLFTVYHLSSCTHPSLCVLDLSLSISVSSLIFHRGCPFRSLLHLSLFFFSLSPHTFDLQLVDIPSLSESAFCFLSASGAILQCRTFSLSVCLSIRSLMEKGMVLFADGQLFWAQLCFSSDINFRGALWSKTARGKLRGHWRGYESLYHVPWWQAAYSSWPIEAEMNGSWGGVWPKLELQLGKRDTGGNDTSKGYLCFFSFMRLSPTKYKRSMLARPYQVPLFQ